MILHALWNLLALNWIQKLFSWFCYQANSRPNVICLVYCRRGSSTREGAPGNCYILQSLLGVKDLPSQGDWGVAILISTKFVRHHCGYKQHR